jgi:ABC-type uncharacterized transport system permease subunit
MARQRGGSWSGCAGCGRRSSVIGLLHLIASCCYLAALLRGIAALRSGTAPASVPILLGVGAALHGAGFVVLHAHQPPIPLETFSTALSLIGWLIPTSYLFSLRVARVRGVGTWVAGAGAVFTGAAAAGLMGIEQLPIPVGSPGNAWSHAHVLLSTFGFSLLALTSLAGLAYLTKKRALKRNEAARFGLPSLESLDRMEHVTLSLGFSLLSLGMATGFVWGVNRGASPWTSHSQWLVAAWAVYLLPVGMRLVSRQHGDRPARIVVAGFAFLAFSYIGIRLLGFRA